MKKVIMISGTARSGSTLLDRMVGNAPDGFSAGELSSLFRPWDKSHLLNSSKKCFCNDEKCSFWFEIKKKGEKKVYETIFDEMDHINFIVDSSKDPIWIEDQINYAKFKNYKIFPMIIYKTPLEFAYSFLKRDLILQWKNKWIKTHLHLFQILDDFRTLRYKDLAKNPSFLLKKICKYVGIPFFKEKEKIWNNKPDHFLFGSNTLRHSKNLIYYNSQYDKQKMNYLENNLDLKDNKLKRIMTVLEGYNILSNSTIDNEIIRLKENIKEFDKINYNFYKIFNSNNFFVNNAARKIIGLEIKVRNKISTH
jgi:hypothetical protein